MILMRRPSVARARAGASNSIESGGDRRDQPVHVAGRIGELPGGVDEPGVGEVVCLRHEPLLPARRRSTSMIVSQGPTAPGGVEESAAPLQMPANRSRADAQHLGYLLERKALHFLEPPCSSRTGRQVVEFGTQGVDQLLPLGLLCRQRARGLELGESLVVERHIPAAPVMVGRLPMPDGEDPGPERTAEREVRQSLPRVQQRFLCEVLGRLGGTLTIRPMYRARGGVTRRTSTANASVSPTAAAPASSSSPRSSRSIDSL